MKQMALQAQSKKVRKARADIARILDRYRLTLPEVIGLSRTRRFNADNEIWDSIQRTYRRAQRHVFAESYPDLWKKLKKR